MDQIKFENYMAKHASKILDGLAQNKDYLLTFNGPKESNLKSIRFLEKYFTELGFNVSAIEDIGMMLILNLSVIVEGV